MRLFAKRQPGHLRQKLAELERDMKISKVDLTLQKVEVLTALKKLGEDMTEQERAYLAEHSRLSEAKFEDDDGHAETEKILALAKE